MDFLIYKRGLDGADIFSDAMEYELWEKLCAEYLTLPVEESETIYKSMRPYRKKHKLEMNLHGKVELLAYSLMPTYIYMVLREKQPGSVTAFMRRVTTYYSMLYNKKRKRRGYVFEGTFKSTQISDLSLLRDVIWLVHQAPATKTVRKFGLVEATSSMRTREYPYSSINDYITLSPRSWITLACEKSDCGKYCLEDREDVSEQARELMAVGRG